MEELEVSEWNSRMRRIGIGASVLAVLLACAAPALADARLVGKALDEGGKPIRDVQIRLLPTDDALSVLETKTKKKGTYIIGVIRPGEYRLVAFADGLRISHIDVNIADPNDDSRWAVDTDMPYGGEMPLFRVSGVDVITYDLTLSPLVGEPGEFGTGEMLSSVDVIVKAIEEGKIDEADREIQRHLTEDPDSATFNYLQAFALLSKNDLEGAYAAVDRALATDPAFEGAAALKGRILEAQGDREGALEWYRKEADSATNDQVKTEAYLAMTVVAEDLGKDDVAQEALEAVIAIAPDQVNLYQELANLYTRTGQIEKAQEMMDKVAELGGDLDPNALYNLGANAVNSGDQEAAVRYFEGAIAAKPDFAEAYLRLGFARLNLGNLEGAAEALRKYLELDPEGSNAAMARDLLSRLPS